MLSEQPTHFTLLKMVNKIIRIVFFILALISFVTMPYYVTALVVGLCMLIGLVGVSFCMAFVGEAYLLSTAPHSIEAHMYIILALCMYGVRYILRVYVF